MKIKEEFGKIRSVTALLLVCVLLMAVLPASSLINLGSSNKVVEVLRVDYKFSNAHITPIKGRDLKEYHYLTLSGTDDVCVASPGLPALPVKGAKILLPYGKELKEINVIGHGKAELTGKYNIYPAQKHVKLTVKPEEVPFVEPDGKIYNALNIYPGKLYECGGVQTFRGYRILLLTLHPVQYIPKRGTIFYYSSLEVELTLTSYMTSEITTFRGLPEDEEEAKEIVDNPSAALTYRSAKTLKTGSSKVPKGGAIPSGTYEYVIITNESLKGTYQLLANHRNTTGVNATVVTVEWILSTPYYATTPYVAVDDQAKIRNFIIDAYNNWSTTYVLLGRDHSEDADIPPNTRIQAREIFVWETDPGKEPHVIPCDLYYGALDGTWDDNGNGKYGEYLGSGMDEADLYAEVYIGRVPSDFNGMYGSKKYGAYAFVPKVIAYENQSSTEEYLGTALMLGEQLDNRPTWGSDGKDVIAHMLPEVYGVTTLSDRDGTYSKEAVIDQLNNNTPHIVNHLGHGSENQVAMLTGSDIEMFTNSKYFLFYSQACLAGRFTYKRSFRSIDTIGEDMILYENVSFAFIGNSYYGYYLPGSAVVDGCSQQYDEQFFHALYDKEYYHIGKAQQKAKEVFAPNVAATVQESAYRQVYFGLNLLGDPYCKIHPPVKVDHDIAVKNKSIPSKVTAGESAYINATIKNIGLNAESNIKVKLFEDGVEVNNTTITSLPVDTGQNVSFLWDAPLEVGDVAISIYAVPVPGEIYTRANYGNGTIYLVGAKFASPIATGDFGLDSGKTPGKYDYLVVNVSVEVIVAATYPVKARLDVTSEWSSNSTSLDVGTHTVQLFWDGTSIYSTYTNGTYTIDNFILYHDRGAGYGWIELSHVPDTYPTQSYNYTDFEAVGGYFSRTISDYALNTDADPEYEYLVINVTVTINSSAYYTLKTEVRNLTYTQFLAEGSNTSYLNVGTHVVQIYVDGFQIYQQIEAGYGYPDHLNNLLLKIRGRADAEAVDSEPGDLLLTKKYEGLAFQGPPVKFNHTYRDYGVDVDGDSKYDHLVIEVDVNVSVSGKYRIKCEPYVNNTWTQVCVCTNHTTLSKGIVPVKIMVSGEDIIAKGLDKTEYMIRFLAISSPPTFSLDYDQVEDSWADDKYVTANYSKSDFEMASARFHTTGITHDLWDTNGNGLADWLRVNQTINVTTTGTYTVKAMFVDDANREICWATVTKHLYAPLGVVALLFDGREIYRHLKTYYSEPPCNLFSVVDGTISDVNGTYVYFKNQVYDIMEEHYYYEFETPPLPDLKVNNDEITFLPAGEVFINDTVTISATVRNNGWADAESVRVQFFEGPPYEMGAATQIGLDKIITAIPFGDAKTVTVTWTPLSAGWPEIWVVLDPYNAILEGDETNNDGMNVKEVKQPSTIIQEAGWTFVTLIRKPPSGYKAGDLANAFGENCTHISMWDNTTQSFVIFAKTSPSVNNFTIEAGVGYYVYTTGPATFSYAWSNIGTVEMVLKQGWNSIGRFNATSTTAEALASSIPNCIAIAYWDTTLGRFIQYIVGSDINNFNIERGCGYLVYVSEDTSWTNSD